MRQTFTAFVLFLAGGLATAQANGGHPVAAIPVVLHWQTFTDPNEDAFQLDVPQGWKVIGGTKRKNALQFRSWATAISPDGATVLGINDPDEPSYATPMYGFARGSVYDGGGGTRYLVEPIQSGQQFAASWGARKLRGLCTSVQVMGSKPRADVAQRINSITQAMGVRHDYGEATFTCERNGIRLSGYAFAGTTVIPTSGTTALWYADTILSFLAPVPVAGVAAGLLAHMVKSVTPNPAWLARQSQTAVSVSHIAAQANAAISNSIMQGWQERGATMDRIMEEGSRTRLGIDVYTNPATGTQYTVENTHRYYWANASGLVVGTDTDTPPGTSFSRLNEVPPQ